MSSLLADGDQVAQVGRTRRIIFVLIALTVLVRAPGLGRPLLGDFATKNVVYAMIARNWALGRADFLTPTLDCLANGHRAWHLLELPLPAYLAGVCWQVCGGSLDAWGRGLSILASVASVVLLYLLARRWHGEGVARAAAVIFALAPVSIVYGQSFMLEASVVALSLGTIWAVTGWRERPSTWRLLLSAGLFGLLVLTKIYMLVLLAPVAWLVLSPSGHAAQGIPTVQLPWSQRWQRFGIVGLALLFGAVPALLWCVFAFSVASPAAPDAGRVFYSLRDSAASHGFPHRLLAEPEFYAGVVRNLATVVLTPVGLLLLLAGLRHESWRRHAVWLASSALLLVILPRKFHEMNYYYLVILPPLCLIAALGWEVLNRHFGGRRVLIGVSCLGLLCSLRYAIRPAFVTPTEDAMVVTAAERIQAQCPPDAWIVTMHGSSIDLLYYADRQGVAIGRDAPNLDEKLSAFGSHGATLLAVADAEFDRLPEQTRRVLAKQSLIESGPGFRLYRLAKTASIDLAELPVTERE